MDDRQIYEKLREFSRARGVSVDQLAQEIGENSQKVGRADRGQRSLTVDYLLKVSKTISLPFEALLEDKKGESTPVEESVSFDSHVLNGVVVLVEGFAGKLEWDSQTKAKMISNIYEILLKLPNENRHLFFHLLRDCLNIILQN